MIARPIAQDHRTGVSPGHFKDFVDSPCRFCDEFGSPANHLVNEHEFGHDGGAWQTRRP